MTKTVEIEYSETFINLTDSLIEHLASFSNEISAINKVEKTINTFEEKVSSNPYSCPVSFSLLQLGITFFREYNHDGLRLIYRVNEADNTITIQGDVLLSQKQDIQKTLIDHCLIFK